MEGTSPAYQQPPPPETTTRTVGRILLWILISVAFFSILCSGIGSA